jgi:hypothetical protein
MTAPPWLRVFALSVLLPAAACSDDPNIDGGTDPPDPTGPPPATFLVMAELDASGGLVRVTDGSVAVAGATVEINGIPGVPGAAEGEYQVRLPDAVAPGGEMTLEVRRGETVVNSTGRLPGVPIVTAPADGSVFDPTVPFRFEWASAAYASRFEAVAIGETTLHIQVPGGAAARAFPFSVGSLGRGDWSLRVNAVSRATMTGDEEPYSLMEIRGGASASRLIRIAPLLLIRGEMGKSNQRIELTLDGIPVDGAVVTVNGVAATQASQGESYVASLSPPLAIGDRLDLSVTVGSEVYTATGSVPPGPPDITDVGGSFTSPVDPVWLEWTSPAGADRFTITAWQCWRSFTFSRDVGGSARRYTFPAGSLPIPREYRFSVTPYDDASFTGLVRPDSRMGIAGAVDHLWYGYC